MSVVYNDYENVLEFLQKLDELLNDLLENINVKSLTREILFEKLFKINAELEGCDQNFLEEIVDHMLHNKHYQKTMDIVLRNDNDVFKIPEYDFLNISIKKYSKLLSIEGDDAIITTDSLSYYIDLIKDVLVMTPEEEKQVFEEYKNTNDELRREELKKFIIDSNLKLVLMSAKKFIVFDNSKFDINDLINEGNFGLIKAIDEFDYNKDCKFSTYATWWINQKILRYITEHYNSIRFPVHVVEVLRKMKAIRYQYVCDNNTEPSNEYLAEQLKCTIEIIKKLRRLEYLFPTSLDGIVSTEEGEDSVLGDYIADTSSEEAYDRIIARTDLNALIEKSLSMNSNLMGISDREWRILQLRYGIVDGRDRTLEEVGKILKISRERVRQIEQNALQKLRRLAKKIDAAESSESELNICSSQLYTINTCYPDLSYLQKLLDFYLYSDSKSVNITWKEYNLITFKCGLCDGNTHNVLETAEKFGMKTEEVNKIEQEVLIKLKMLESQHSAPKRR